ncbi:hypothetical protein GCM10008986_00910 [Salinibacillus aidingensis]|uniref:Uncharacterized protein n=1 Tax=Salinibacillus aidingensis TaxID=237684 RepID=A0ABN1AMP3_9BACI
MVFQPEFQQLFKEVVQKLERENVVFTQDQQQVLKQAFKDCYDTGYEDGITDGTEISERPISG